MYEFLQTSVVLGTVLATEHMRKDKGGCGGRIINISSVAGDGEKRGGCFWGVGARKKERGGWRDRKRWMERQKEMYGETEREIKWMRRQVNFIVG